MIMSSLKSDIKTIEKVISELKSLIQNVGNIEDTENMDLGTLMEIMMLMRVISDKMDGFDERV